MARRSVTDPPSLVAGQQVDELVLPVVPGSLHNRAMNLTVRLAELWGLPIRVIHVVDPTRSIDLDLDSTVNDMKTWYPGLSIGSDPLVGDEPAAAIVRSLRPGSLAVVASDHADAWSFKDSIAEAVVSQSHVPMLLVGPDVKRATPGGDVVVGFDGSAAGETAVVAAVGLAEAMELRLAIVRVVPEPRAGDDLHLGHTSDLQRLAERFEKAVGARWEVVYDNNPIHAIESFARRHEAGFIVVGSRGRRDQTRRSMSSIAMGLVATAEQPVLVVKGPPT